MASSLKYSTSLGKRQAAYQDAGESSYSRYKAPCKSSSDLTGPLKDAPKTKRIHNFEENSSSIAMEESVNQEENEVTTTKYDYEEQKEKKKKHKNKDKQKELRNRADNEPEKDNNLNLNTKDEKDEEGVKDNEINVNKKDEEDEEGVKDNIIDLNEKDEEDEEDGKDDEINVNETDEEVEEGEEKKKKEKEKKKKKKKDKQSELKEGENIDSEEVNMLQKELKNRADNEPEKDNEINVNKKDEEDEEGVKDNIIDLNEKDEEDEEDGKDDEINVNETDEEVEEGEEKKKKEKEKKKKKKKDKQSELKEGENIDSEEVNMLITKENDKDENELQSFAEDNRTSSAKSNSPIVASVISLSEKKKQDVFQKKIKSNVKILKVLQAEIRKFEADEIQAAKDNNKLLTKVLGSQLSAKRNSATNLGNKIKKYEKKLEKLREPKTTFSGINLTLSDLTYILYFFFSYSFLFYTIPSYPIL